MASPSHAFTARYVAEQLGANQNLIEEIAATQMDPKDGVLSVIDSSDETAESVVVFTRFGIDRLKELLEENTPHGPRPEPDQWPSPKAYGLMNAIMFPTIFSLASEGLGSRAAEGSGIIATAIVGGAVIPLLTGAIADHSSLQVALALPAICYAIIAGFGLFARRPTVDVTGAS